MKPPTPPFPLEHKKMVWGYLAPLWGTSEKAQKILIIMEKQQNTMKNRLNRMIDQTKLTEPNEKRWISFENNGITSEWSVSWV